MLESPNTTEFIIISPYASDTNSERRNEQMEKNIKKLLKPSGKEEVKFQEVTFNSIKLKHLNH